MSVESKPIASPCVSICALDENDVCVGCHRTGQEIAGWGMKSEPEKAEIMERVREREKGSYI
ncbi:Fe-S oxidoreductase [Oleiphilus sp. HI0125]|uniref:DUF1289 domain-containing protein n=1 Tax=Oleiphilus sp. HI0125 TaxID=1822266 RepID=UPI0007C37405|nr:DUF1289 domain-containing protein [Oleiphilus sp. HI0125]KZZ59663.1 Fe-S oxidoreductase [Oleiphilus sp. HI0125]